MAGNNTNNSSGNKLVIYDGPDGTAAEGDAYTQESEFLTERWSPGSVGTLHRYSDIDSSQLSQHHTLGPRHNQSAPGDHSHDGVTSKNIGVWTVWAAAATSWTAQTTNPSLGANGVIEGKYSKIGTRVTYRFTLIAGSTTTFGTGAWLFGIPFPAVMPVSNSMAPPAGPCKGFQSGVANRVGVAFLFDSTHIMLVSDGNANVWQSNNPVTWAANSGNNWGFEIVYESQI